VTGSSTTPDSTDDAELLECDLVMKGGITSGVVYPTAVLELKEKYRFVNIGGASAGAIAAVATAAAEYRRQAAPPGQRDAGFEALRTLIGEMAEPGVLQGMFQPVPSGREAFDLVLASLDSKGTSMSAKAKAFGRVVLGHHPVGVIVGALVTATAWFGLGLLGWALSLVDSPSSWSGGGIALAVVTLAIVATLGCLGGALVGMGRAALRLLRTMATTGFGLCPGPRQPGFDHDGLTDWLHAKVQACAGLPPDRPLTFGDLKRAGINLETMTTDLSFARPMRLPFEFNTYLFRPDEMRFVFPEAIVSWMASHPGEPSSRCGVPPTPDETPSLSWMPDVDDLPVLVAARMSLSFPALISAVPLYTQDCANPDRPIVRVWFSDGGISSNFPIHFFDGWLPGRPTFGLNLGPYPSSPSGRALARDVEVADGEDDWATGDVFMPSSRLSGRFPRWAHIDDVFSFYGSILTTMQNWRDNLQSEIPGFRDRVCEIRLNRIEGGMNLNMAPDTIESLVRKGGLAGERLRDTFNFAQHQFTRYLMLMETLQLRIAGDATHPGVRDRYQQFGPVLAVGAPDAKEYRELHDPEWCIQADRATRELLETVHAWQEPMPDRDAIEFVMAEEKQPAWVMRISPKV
jgi:predicted acylesterase/phospholipase RssA